MKNELVRKIGTIFSKTTLKIKKYSPDILMVAGVAGTVAGTVMACKATLKVNDILEENKDVVEKIHSCLDRNLENYTEEDAKKDLTITYTQTAVKLIKIYAPAILVTGLSITSIIAGHGILKKRNLAIAAAYMAVDTSFKNYRKNVISKYGKEVDNELRYSIKTKEVEKTDENGKPHKELVEVVDEKALETSIYSRFFDCSCEEFRKDPEYNMRYLMRQQDYANEKLKAQGHLFLNEVYDMLDIPRSQAGQVVGWVYDTKNPKGDNYVDFGLHRNDPGTRRFVNGMEYNILLDFNVDGIIYDLI